MLSLCATRLILAILVVCAGIPAYATTDIQPNGNVAGGDTAANCTQPVLGTYSGSANFEAKWRANTVPLRWYNNNTLMENVAAASNTCDYDGTLTIPATPPSRTGYTFGGWRVRPTYDFSSLDISSNGTEKLAKVLNYGDVQCFRAVGGKGAQYQVTTCDNSLFSDLALYEYKVHFSWGTIYGMATCRNNSVDWCVTGTPSDIEGKYCWCKLTGFIPNDNNPNNTMYGPVATLSWMFTNDDGSLQGCQKECAQHCINATEDYPYCRQSLFGVD